MKLQLLLKKIAHVFEKENIFAARKQFISFTTHNSLYCIFLYVKFLLHNTDLTSLLSRQTSQVQDDVNK